MKLFSSKMLIFASNIIFTLDLRFSIVCFGNFMESISSAIPSFLEKLATGMLLIACPLNNSFQISLGEVVIIMLWPLEKVPNGEVPTASGKMSPLLIIY